MNKLSIWKWYIYRYAFQNRFLYFILLDAKQPCGEERKVLLQTDEEIPIEKEKWLTQCDPSGSGKNWNQICPISIPGLFSAVVL